MKKIILFCLAIGSFASSAQILNPGFELVTGTKPSNYNLTTSYFDYSTFYIRDTSDSRTGIHAAYIKGFGGQSYAIQGSIYGLFSASGKPTAFTAWYKCNLMPGDSLVVTPFIYSGNTNSPSLGAYGFTTLSSSVYKQISATFNYSAYPVPSIDTVYIAIYLSGPNVDAQNVFIPQTGTWAIIDDLELVQPITTAITEHNGNSNIEKVYPQPCSNLSNLVYTIDQIENSSLVINDITGKQIKTVFENERQSPGRYKAEIDMTDFSPGVYFANLTVGKEIRVSKIIKQ